jgi:hypothetical protein
MSLEENKAIVRRFLVEGVIGGNLAVIDDLCSPECINHSAVPEARHRTWALRDDLGLMKQLGVIGA